MVCSPLSRQSVGREKDGIRCLNTKMCGTKNNASNAEHKAKTDELLKNEIANGYGAVVSRSLGQDVGALELANVAFVLMWRNGTNSKVTFEDRLVIG